MTTPTPTSDLMQALLDYIESKQPYSRESLINDINGIMQALVAGKLLRSDGFVYTVNKGEKK